LVTLAAIGWVIVALLAVSWAGAAEPPEPPEYVRSFGPDGTEATEFAETGPVAVDQQSEVVYAADRSSGSLFKFDAEGHELAFGGSASYISGNEISGLEFEESRAAGRNQIAVDSASHVIYVTESYEEGSERKGRLRAFQSDGEEALFSAGPGAGTSEIAGFEGGLYGVAVDENGDIYVSEPAGAVRVFTATGEPITEFAVAEPDNLAVDGNGVVYVMSGDNAFSNQILRFTPSEIPVSSTTTYTSAAGPSAPEPNTLTVDPGTNDVFVAQIGFSKGISWYDEFGTLVAKFAGPGEPGEIGTSGGLAVDAGSGKLFVGNNTAGANRVEVFRPKVFPPGPPSIVSTSARDISSSAATLLAEINPNTLATTYRFEYGLADCSVSVCASVPVGGAEIGAGHVPVPVAQMITDLQPDTTYHYRVVAQNDEGTTEGPDRLFMTQSGDLGFQLADGRAWEMVSPPDKHGGRLVGSTWGLIQASANGDSIAFLSKGSIEAELEGSRSPEASTVLARRGAEGWRSRDISTPNDSIAPASNGDRGEYKLFDSELSRALLAPRSATPLSPEASERTPYLREEGEPAVFRPLVTGKEGYANVPDGTEFGGKDTEALGPVAIRGAGRDLSHVVIQSSIPLAEGAPPAPNEALYEWAGGDLALVSVLPDSEEGGEAVGALLGGKLSTRNAVSEDGSRVLWTARSTLGLYMRDTTSGESGRLDVKQAGAGGVKTPRPQFQGASADGTVIFFSDEQQLTEDASPSGSDLYRCVVPEGAVPPVCATLTDLSAVPGGGESGDVQELIPAFGEDGSRAYFVAEGVLDSAPNQNGENAEPGQPNLYLWQEGDGVRFAARLSEKDLRDWSYGDYLLSAAASPSGRYLAFESGRELTGYDNRDVQSGEAVQEAFVYDAVSDRLSCVSCIPTGARPHVGVLAVRTLVDPRGVWHDTRVGATLAEATAATVAGPSLYRPRGVLDNGRVFFNAVDPLVPGDSNGQWDVYQWEPAGVGDCGGSPDGASVSRSAGGCVSLISSGTAEGEAAFMDASASGDDAFFLTPARLSATDTDQELDLYDARVGGSPATVPPSSECSGEGCQPIASAPSETSPASASFNGPGNLHRRCVKGRHAARRHKASCAKRRHRHRTRRHRAKAHHGRRAHR